MRRVDLRPIGNVTNVGQSWTTFGNRIAVVPGQPGISPTLYAAADDGVYKSTNGGYSWNSLIAFSSFLSVVEPPTQILYHPGFKSFYLVNKFGAVIAINFAGTTAKYQSGENAYEHDDYTFVVNLSGVWHDNWHWPKREHCGPLPGMGWTSDFEPTQEWLDNRSNVILPIFKPYGTSDIMGGISGLYEFNTVGGEPYGWEAKRGSFVSANMDFDLCVATNMFFGAGIVKFKRSDNIVRNYLINVSYDLAQRERGQGRTYVRADEIDDVKPAVCVANQKGHVIYSHGETVKYRLVEFGNSVKYPASFPFRMLHNVEDNACGYEPFYRTSPCMPFLYDIIYFYKNGLRRYGQYAPLVNNDPAYHLNTHRTTYDFNWHKGPNVADSRCDALLLKSSENIAQRYIYAIMRKGSVLSYKRLDVSSNVHSSDTDYENIAKRSWSEEVEITNNCSGDYGAVVLEDGSGMYVFYQSLSGVYAHVKVGDTVSGLHALNITGVNNLNVPKKHMLVNPFDILEVSPLTVIKDGKAQIITVVGDPPVINAINGGPFKAGQVYRYDLSNSDIEESKKVILSQGDGDITWSINWKRAYDYYTGAFQNSYLDNFSIESDTGKINYVIPEAFGFGLVEYEVQAVSLYGSDKKYIKFVVDSKENPVIELIKPTVDQSNVAHDVAPKGPIDFEVHWKKLSSGDYLNANDVDLLINGVSVHAPVLWNVFGDIVFGAILSDGTRYKPGWPGSRSIIENMKGVWCTYSPSTEWRGGQTMPVTIVANHRMPGIVSVPGGGYTLHPIDATSTYDFVMQTISVSYIISLKPGWNFIGFPCDDSVNNSGGYVSVVGKQASFLASKTITENSLVDGDVQQIIRYNNSKIVYLEAVEVWNYGGADSDWVFDGEHAYFVKINENITKEMSITCSGKSWEISYVNLKKGHNWINLPKNDYKKLSDLVSKNFIDEVQVFNADTQVYESALRFLEQDKDLGAAVGCVVVNNVDFDLEFAGEDW